MKPKPKTRVKQNPNERVLARLLHHAYLEMTDDDYHDGETLAAFLARRGVLAVCAKTVPLNMPTQADPPSYYEWPDFRTYLRCLARGAR